MSKLIKMEIGNMYYIRYIGGTELIVRYLNSNATQHNFFTHIHYWNGYEKYRRNGWSLKSGIEEIRRATQPEKHNLFRNEIENEDV